jgi:glycogen debranching enzyme
MNADAVDLNAMWVMDAECLAKMADLLGLPGDSRRLRAEIERTNKLINAILWNEDLGIYCHRLWDDRGKPGKFLTRLTPMNFYPLICGAPDEARARRMIRTLTNDRMFWGNWPVPTLPYSDPDWSKQDYWKGHTWPPTNYLIFQGVKRYCTPRQQYELAVRSVKMFMQNWTAHGTCNETYNSTDGSGDRFPHYSWGALMCQIGIEALIDANPFGPPSVRPGAEFWGDFTMKGIPSGGKLYRVSSKAGIVSVEASG